MAIIVNGKRVAGLGKPGKSAYQAAVEGGYTKTETEFNDSLSKIDDLFTSVSDGKSAVAAAITDKGVETAADATFQQMADNIGAIKSGKFNLINATVKTENTIDVNSELYSVVVLSGNPPAGSEDVSDVGFATVYAAKYNFGSVSVQSETMMVAAGGEVQLSFSGSSKIQYSDTAITGGNFPLGWEYQIVTFDAEL